MAITPENFTRVLADATRLRLLVLLQAHDELCVCELTEALAVPQPKISRHLAILRESGMLLDRRSGLWIHYRIHPDLPAWASDALHAIGQGCIGKQPFEQDQERLSRQALRSTGTCS
jgi:ArsR family transcriptional regulator